MKYNVLIVEDDQTMRFVIKQTLNESSLDIGEIYESENGMEGLEMMEKHQDINLLLVDIYMPVMDGIEMLGHVQNHPEFKNIPAVVVSTENNEKRIDAIVRQGLGFVHKPFTRYLLEEKIVKLTEKKDETSIR